jgi:glutathione peroxidase-family protein
MINTIHDSQVLYVTISNCWILKTRDLIKRENRGEKEKKISKIHWNFNNDTIDIVGNISTRWNQCVKEPSQLKSLNC